MTIHDASQRLKALNPKKSFIVQAPAGSGKTELLIQRILVLLSFVKQPEEILAITFTRKSASEMRSRIISALQNARQEVEPETEHAKTTWELAKKVLHQDKLLQWNLLKNPSRLRIQTIDSFNSSLTKQLPLLSHFGAAPEITDDPSILYRQTVQEFLSHLEENLDWSDAIATLLLHLDNDLTNVETLLINLLAKRDQWLPYIMVNSQDQLLRQTLEKNLHEVASEILTQLYNSFPKQHVEECLTLARFAATNLLTTHSNSPITFCANLQTLPTPLPENKNYWLGLAELFFKKTDEDWRRRVDKSHGFPADLKEMKQRMEMLLEQLSQHDDLLNNFIELKNLPAIKYQDNQWEILQALHQILQVVAAQLKLTFQQHRKMDYIENAQAALTALGSEDSPTDLTLALDYQIKHILIDEFQDTSNSQFRLLEKLTWGWELNDGRTLFIVGDPMQSIYRFREAEVGLFIRSREKSIGNIFLEPLTLSVNFRSTPEIVNWVNQVFPLVFPSKEDIGTGAVSYSASTPLKNNNSKNSSVMLHPFLDAENFTQAQAIVELIQQCKKDSPSESIAILVSSRNHLEYIIPALKNANIPYRAINIDPLTARPFIQDLMALTRALIHSADRIAWLAILRAPWCGLSLHDLLLLTGNDPKISLWERLQSNEVISTLSEEGQNRVLRILPTLKIKLAERRRESLRYWIESTWLLLGGPACLNQTSDLEDAKTYFTLLEKMDKGGDLLHLDLLSEKVNKLFASPDPQADNSLQIMTIHNAKGLEFDTVILPHLERKTSLDDKQLLLWMERPIDKGSSLLLAPINATGEEKDPIYTYIKKQQAIKNDYEKSRLLYVAVTRAKKNLHLFFNLKSDAKKNYKPGTNSLLEKLWPSIREESLSILSHASQSSPQIVLQSSSEIKNLKRLTFPWINPVKENRLAEKISFYNKNSGFALPNLQPKLIGTLIHRILQQLCEEGSTWWEQRNHQEKQAYLTSQLLQLGIVQTHLSAAIDVICKAIQNTLNDSRGRWIIHSHNESKAEYPLTAVIDQVPHQFIIDRTFVDENNVRWIIDYKTAVFSGEDLEIFLQSERQRYQQQMQNYYFALKEIEAREIRGGLYFPVIQAWCELSF